MVDNSFRDTQELVTTRHIRVNLLIKQNIVELLGRRRFHQQDLAWACRRDLPKPKAGQWLSKILTSPKHNLPIEYWDRVADFFGIATYQLLQPGIAGASERRRGGDRRVRPERRMSRRVLGMEPRTDAYAALWDEIRTLAAADLETVRDFVAGLRSHDAGTSGRHRDTSDPPGETETPARTPRRKRGHG